MSNFVSARKNIYHDIKYDWNAPLVPGTVVCAKYEDFDGKQRVGLFVVLYDEQLDTNTDHCKNTICCKLSTQTTLVSTYSARIDLNYNSFLETPCIACCSKIHVLHKETNIYKVLGKLSPGTMKLITKMYVKFMNETQRQLLDSI